MHAIEMQAVPAKRDSLVSLIAWLSLCLLAVAWGPSLDPANRRVWAHIGLWGLAAAVGLKGVERSRRLTQLRKCEKQREQSQRAQEQSLDRFKLQARSIEAVRVAVERIVQSAGSEVFQTAGSEADIVEDRRCELRVPLRLPVTLLPFGEDQAHAVSVRDISKTGISLAHETKLPKGRVLVLFEIPDAEPIGLIAEILWCQRTGDQQYISGESLVDVADAEFVHAALQLA